MGDAKLMPVEVLTRDEIEKIIEEKLRKIIDELAIKKKLTDLESATNELKSKISSPPSPKPKVSETEMVAQTLLRDLGERTKFLEISIKGDTVVLKKRHYLKIDDFKKVEEIIKKHGGSWSSLKNAFIIRKGRE